MKKLYLLLPLVLLPLLLLVPMSTTSEDKHIPPMEIVQFDTSVLKDFQEDNKKEAETAKILDQLVVLLTRLQELTKEV